MSRRIAAGATTLVFDAVRLTRGPATLAASVVTGDTPPGVLDIDVT